MEHQEVPLGTRTGLELGHGDQALQAILRNEVVAEKLVSFLSFEDMMACSETSQAFCVFTRCTKAFGDKVMLTISNKVMEEGTVLKDTKHSWKSVCIREPLSPPNYNRLDNILASVTTLRLQITRKQANSISKEKIEEFLRHVIGQCKSLQSLQLEPIFLEYCIFSSMPNEAVNPATKDALLGLKEFQIISESKGNGFRSFDNRKYEPFTENVLRLCDLPLLSLKSLKIGTFIYLNPLYRHYAVDRVVREMEMQEYQGFGRTLVALISSTSSKLGELQLSQWQFWEDAEPFLPKLGCPNLKRLELELSTTSLAGVNNLGAFLRNQPPLKELSIEFGGRAMRVREEEGTKLRILHLLKTEGGPFTRLKEEFLLKLLILGDFRSLVELYSKIDEIWEEDFMRTISCPNLKRLEISTNMTGTTNVREFLKNQPPLEHLFVEIVDGSNGARWLTLCKGKESNLKIMHLCSNAKNSPEDSLTVDWDFIASLEKKSLPDFTANLVEVHITIASYWELNLMKDFQCSRLKRLELKSTPKGLNNVCGFLQNAPPLIELSIKFNEVFDVKVLKIIEQRGAHLKKLHLTAKSFREDGRKVLVNWGFLSELKTLEDFSIARPFKRPEQREARVDSSQPLEALEGTGVTFLRALPPSLKKLRLRGINLFWTEDVRDPWGDKIEQKAVWTRFNSLTHLSITRCDAYALDQQLFQIIQKNNPGLMELEFSHVFQPFMGKGSLDSLKDLSSLSIKSCSPCMYNKNSHVDGILQAVALPSLRTLDFLPDRPLSEGQVMQLALQNQKLESISVPVSSKLDINDLKKVNKRIQRFAKLKWRRRANGGDQDSDSDADSSGLRRDRRHACSFTNRVNAFLP